MLGLEADLLRETDSSAALLQLDARQARRLGTTGSSTLLQLDAGEARKRGRLSSTLLQPDAREEGKRGRLGTKGSSSPLQPDARKKRRWGGKLGLQAFPGFQLWQHRSQLWQPRFQRWQPRVGKWWQVGSTWLQAPRRRRRISPNDPGWRISIQSMERLELVLLMPLLKMQLYLSG